MIRDMEEEWCWEFTFLWNKTMDVELVGKHFGISRSTAQDYASALRKKYPIRYFAN